MPKPVAAKKRGPVIGSTGGGGGWTTRWATGSCGAGGGARARVVPRGSLTEKDWPRIGWFSAIAVVGVFSTVVRTSRLWPDWSWPLQVTELPRTAAVPTLALAETTREPSA